ncbi:unnamed protein product [Lactuca saligna]|uniref:SWIM-type domain-containing protein n=1 Tax=Lactuca saligna TaxID=75948 RepID=A0AA35ZY07_LACSI|nr:unnamed protein product [Lactuca saligna]
MVFVPLTRIDIHKKCVTFGVGLLSKEDIDSYTWLLKSFLKAFGKQPILLLSDEDLAMKNAIANVFPESIHRLCMWQITSKLPLKIKEFRPHGYSILNRPESDIFSDDDDDNWDKLLKDSIYTVKCDQKEDSFICSCMKFEEYGILCRHIFIAMKAFNIQFILAKYLLRRWQKDIIPPELLRRCFRYSDSDENIQKVAINIFSTVDNCLSSLSTNKKKTRRVLSST